MQVACNRRARVPEPSRLRWPRLSAPWLIVCASFLFATMGVCVKLASTQYAAGELVFYRSLIGTLMVVGLVRLRGGRLATTPLRPRQKCMAGTVVRSVTPCQRDQASIISAPVMPR